MKDKDINCILRRVSIATYDRIDTLLHEASLAKARIKGIRGELIRIAVSDLGMDQAAALACDIETFMRGYCSSQEIKK